CLQYNSKPLTF
nr:immunoglobulin light chain junction region [Macaca mulatta]MOV74293.1 immunoglobulin light chain junction region [Macaca mulatta]MOV74476.1 immunoglobulin light chain junction region [Macaca mulatta]MOV74483.1 immunoglobulin light chain junction region [Macaca mulatta]MOV74515.1 immunoglobulin light chain junction region [Macaca mulatta]